MERLIVIKLLLLEMKRKIPAPWPPEEYAPSGHEREDTETRRR
jgi:hypothetical protein